MKASDRRTLFMAAVLIAASAIIAYLTIPGTVGGHAEKDASMAFPVTAAEERKSAAHRAPAVQEPRITREELRKRYGWLEIVTLYDGRVYEGAVLAADDAITLVTVEGEMTIPIRHVKVRDIVR
ncbi:MAG: hypothetical protein KBA61_16445 [Spirochaetes bacterium]|nr:hypothetical protein [Spirochaetota bacterium]